jgi:hypothetical protein
VNADRKFSHAQTPRPFLEVATTNPVPPGSSLLMPTMSSSSPSLQHDHIHSHATVSSDASTPGESTSFNDVTWGAITRTRMDFVQNKLRESSLEKVILKAESVGSFQDTAEVMFLMFLMSCL